MKKTILLSVTLIGLICIVNAQNPQWINYNTSNSGLPDNSVRSIAIEDDGTKWIGTYSGGLAKFDGTDWTTYDTSNSDLPDDYVTSIAIEENGLKWIGTESGLAAFDGANWTIYDDSNSELPYNGITSIAIDGSGMKWIGTFINTMGGGIGGGLTAFDGTNWTTYYTWNSGLPSNYVKSIAISENGTKWIGTGEGGLAEFDGTNWTTYNGSNSGLQYGFVMSIAIEESGTKWIGARSSAVSGGCELAEFDGTNWTIYNTSNSGLPSNWIQSIAISENGTKWFGTGGGGLAEFDGTNWTTYNTSNSGLPSNYVQSIAIDESGTKWIGTGGGLAAYNENGIPVSVNENRLTENKVFIFPNPAKNEFFISAKDGIIITGVNIYNQIGQRLIHKKGKTNTVDVSKLPKGMYIIEIEIDNGKYRNKLMIE